MTEYDAIVVGGGIMGAATTRELARRGRKVLLLERFGLGHDRGSSHGNSRIFRFSYPNPMYVAMAQESLPLWRELEKESGEDLLKVTGGLDRGPLLSEHAAALAARGASYKLLDGNEINERFPFMSLPGNEPVLYQPDAGIIAADRALSVLLIAAERDGAEIRERCEALALEPNDGGVVVSTAHGSFRAEVVIVTAGAWAKSLLRGAGIELAVRPTRETVAYFDLDEASIPPLVEWGTPSLYALPAPGIGLKVGEHQAGREVDPDDAGAPDGESVERLKAWVRERYPSAGPEPLRLETCLYTNTVDDSFIIERQGRIVIGSPCSGHGFKFAPLVGQRLAELALD